MPVLEMAQRSVAPLALGLLALFPPQAPAPEAKPFDLSGRFTRNNAESEDAREKLRKAMEGRRPPRGGPGGSPGMGGGRPGGAGGPPGGPPETRRAPAQPPQAMTITHTATEIVVMEEDGRLRTLHPDGKAYKAEAGAVEVRTRWDGGRLLVETKAGRGPKVSESWSLDPAGGKLTITTSIEGSGAPVSIRSVYDREDRADFVEPRPPGR